MAHNPGNEMRSALLVNLIYLPYIRWKILLAAQSLSSHLRLRGNPRLNCEGAIVDDEEAEGEGEEF